ncbi:MAG TPA: hypothetical protein VLZ83_17105 [Edaphocola sp.]|nr:hypothetical protein [Edaphocola sp.]
MKKIKFLIGMLLLTISSFSYSQNTTCSIPKESLASLPNETAMRELNRVCNAKNEDALKSLIINSKAFILDAKTKVIVLKTYFTTSDIKVISGPNRGIKMRISNEHLICK